MSEHKSIQAMLMATIAIGDAIHKLGQIPEGHLYAQVMGKLTLDQFNMATETLIKQKLIQRKNNVLSWIA